MNDLYVLSLMLMLKYTQHNFIVATTSGSMLKALDDTRRLVGWCDIALGNIFKCIASLSSVVFVSSLTFL